MAYFFGLLSVALLIIAAYVNNNAPFDAPRVLGFITYQGFAIGICSVIAGKIASSISASRRADAQKSADASAARIIHQTKQREVNDELDSNGKTKDNQFDW